MKPEHWGFQVGAMILISGVSTFGVTITVNPSVRYQEIDGFGGFGGEVNWCCNPPPYTSQNWANLMIDTLGLTLLRTELYPEPDQSNMNSLQYEALRAIKAKADASGEPLKVFASVWTPPARMKDNGNTTGGHLKPDSISAYGTYLVNLVRQFNTQLGFDLYAVSPQNEPALSTGYNSCSYYPGEFAAMFKGVAARFKAMNLACWLHYADNIPWGGSDWQGQVIRSVCTDPIADSIGAIMSIHYDGDDGCFAAFRAQAAGTHPSRTVNIGKKSRMWNTEWGGFFDDWSDDRLDESRNRPGGAFTAAKNLLRCLAYDFNAVIYWALGDQKDPAGSGSHYSMYYRINGQIRKGPLFYTMKQFYRYIRPGAVRIGCVSSDSAAVKAIAFTHADQQTKTVVILNLSSSVQTATVSGAGLPSSMNVYQTSPTQNCALIGAVSPGTPITLPVKSITTLYNAPTLRLRSALPAAAPLVRRGAPQRFGLNGRRLPSPDQCGSDVHVIVDVNGKRSVIVSHAR